MPLASPIRATRPAHLILLDFITRTILGEEYRTLSSSLCSEGSSYHHEYQNCRAIYLYLYISKFKRRFHNRHHYKPAELLLYKLTQKYHGLAVSSVGLKPLPGSALCLSSVPQGKRNVTFQK